MVSTRKHKLKPVPSPGAVCLSVSQLPVHPRPSIPYLPPSSPFFPWILIHIYLPGLYMYVLHPGLFRLVLS